MKHSANIRTAYYISRVDFMVTHADLSARYCLQFLEAIDLVFNTFCISTIYTWRLEGTKSDPILHVWLQLADSYHTIYCHFYYDGGLINVLCRDTNKQTFVGKVLGYPLNLEDLKKQVLNT